MAYWDMYKEAKKRENERDRIMKEKQEICKQYIARATLNKILRITGDRFDKKLESEKL